MTAKIMFIPSENFISVMNNKQNIVKNKNHKGKIYFISRLIYFIINLYQFYLILNFIHFL